MVGLYVEHRWPTMCPQIAKILQVDHAGEEMLIQWYHATWHGKCTAAIVGVGRNRKPEEEMVDIRCAVLWDFSLTHGQRIKDVTRQRLKQAYSDLGRA